MWQTAMRRTKPVRDIVGQSTGRRACLDQMGQRGIALRTAADPTFRVIASRPPPANVRKSRET